MHFRLPAAVAAAAAAAILTACTAQTAATDDDHASASSTHVHAIITDPATGGTILGTHEGLLPVGSDGAIGEPIGGYEFDAMGLAVVGDAFVASGHPGANTPSEWGSPHLGIIRSDDAGRSWEPMAYSGTKDFHALAAGPDGILYGLATDDPALLTSADGGATWGPAGADLSAYALAVDSTRTVYATTPDGVMFSVNEGTTFAPVPDSPALYLLSASPDRATLVGADTSGTIWVSADAAASWTEAGVAEGQAQAVALTSTGEIAVVDEAGLRFLPGGER
ncbi:F510_1955 family glycosylhydrolase [Microbacterium thalassium]|uniref:Exo-alpha-sialidase n=1 Tax=Microbacterium thalassium TaxID=362649 RepID=A0A7X0FTQ1_9MICO|nr:sialidase family protein [Microbacterium thalassium]MBB6392992.1 hypothetical protein [Microbacterium thalassium]GLK22776.1 hypothetical protein GCM10017607_00940 [Microbacterium thalassium]